MNGVASQNSQPQSLLNTSTISGPAGIPDHISGAGSTSSNQQALQHSPHHDSTSPNVTSDSPSPSDLEPLTTTAGVTEALAPKEQPPGDKNEEEQEPVFIKEEAEVLHGTVNGQIELLEHTPEPNVGSGDAEVMVNDSDAQDWIPDADHELKRVKVCQPYPPSFIDQVIIIMPCSMAKSHHFLPITHYSSSGVRTYRLTVDGSRDSVLLWPVSRRDK
jgi:protein phosphatase 4 regulatory subunit 3